MSPVELDDLPSPVLVTDSEGSILRVNSDFCRLTGCDASALVSRQVDLVLTAATRIFFQTHVWPTLRRCGEIKEIFFNIEHPQSGRVGVYANAKRVHKDSRTQFIWLFFVAKERERFESELIAMRRRAERVAEQLQDAHARLRTMHEQLEERVLKTIKEKQSLEKISQTDALTGLRNRRSLELLSDEFSSDTRRRQRFSILMVDIDHFKSVNDTYGHDHGDAVLRRVAQCIQGVARQGDSAFRYGGEEFLLVLPDTAPEQAVAVAARIHSAVEQAQPGGLPLTVSIGIASSTDGLDDVYTILGLADKALYAAKRQGRNRTVNSHDLTTKVRRGNRPANPILTGEP